jgi:hypothetical protein
LWQRHQYMCIVLGTQKFILLKPVETDGSGVSYTST